MMARTRNKVKRLARRMEAWLVFVSALRLTASIASFKTTPARWYAVYPHDPIIGAVGHGKLA